MKRPPEPTPEDVIQAAFAQRSNRERDARLAQGFSARQVPLPPWAPEVAAAALRERGMLNVGGSDRGQQLVPSSGLAPDSAASVGPDTHPSSCKGSCSPDPGVEDGTAWEAGICGPARPLTAREFEAFDQLIQGVNEMSGIEQGLRDIADGGEWPEVAS